VFNSEDVFDLIVFYSNNLAESGVPRVVRHRFWYDSHVEMTKIWKWVDD